MNKYAVVTALAILLSAAAPPLFARVQHHAPAAAHAGVSKHADKKKAAAKSTAGPRKAQSKSASSPAKKIAEKENAGVGKDGDSAEAAEESAAETAPRSLFSAALEEAIKQYRANPSAPAYAQLLEAMKATVVAGGLRVSAAAVVKDNPSLSDFKPRVIETNGVRVWNFPRAQDRSRVLLQWSEVKQQIVGTGRRKKVVTSTSMHCQQLALASPINVKDAGAASTRESGRRLLLSGENEDGTLCVQAYKLSEGSWQSCPDCLAQIPSFLTNNMTGRIGFKGADLIYNVGKMIQTTDSSGTRRLLPEAESATYKYWLKFTDAGYVVATAVPDEEAFAVVFQFMQALQQSRTAEQKALLGDPRLSSLPKYLGLAGKPLDPAVRVVEMTVPAAHGQRFRLINAGKDDLIFDVGKVKGQWQVKAIFIAPPDEFLAETAKYFPLYSSFVQKNEAKNEAAEKKDAGSEPAAGAGSSIPSIKKKR
jgi:hypothetical protein